MTATRSWHDHIDYVCDKVSKSINIMTKIKSYLGKQCLTSIYYSLVYPCLVYGCLLWGNNYDNPLSQLIRASAQQLHIPHSRINIRKFCPIVIGKYYLNDLLLSIRNRSTKILFKKTLKKYYLAQ